MRRLMGLFMKTNMTRHNPMTTIELQALDFGWHIKIESSTQSYPNQAQWLHSNMYWKLISQKILVLGSLHWMISVQNLIISRTMKFDFQ